MEQTGKPGKPEFTRRDFVGNTLLGSGAALLVAASPAAMRSVRAQTFDSPLDDLPLEWSGPGGIGDYAGKNGNTAPVVNAGHGMIRDGKFADRMKNARLVDDVYDLIVIGSGISGLTSAYVFQKARPDARILVLDQHDIFGGEAKMNQFNVDGVQMHGPQGSTVMNLFPEYPFLKELKLEQAPPFAAPQHTALKIPWNSWGPMLWAQAHTDQAYFIEGKGFVLNPWRNNLADLPMPEDVKRGIIQVIEYAHPEQVEDAGRVLDSMTYKEFLLHYVKVSPDVIDAVCAYFDQTFAAAGGYRCAWMSAYTATLIALPAVVNFGNPQPFFYNMPIDHYSDEFQKIFHSGQFPGGNAHIARRFLKLARPDAIEGELNFRDIEYGRVNWAVLDRPEDRYRLRMSSTVFSVAHDDESPSAASHVMVHYAKGGQMFAVRGKRAICSGQQHINRHICRDISADVRQAMQAFHHQPIAVVNVALRNWRFLEKIGAASIRWFEGLGWFTSLHQSFNLDGVAEVLDPDKPVVLSLFIPFFAGEEGDSYDRVATDSRMLMFSTPFSDIEDGIREQFTKMFGPYGFDADRDIAGIIANRQGHAYSVNPPGFYFGRDGKPSPLEILRKPFHRIAFGHSELGGHQAWNTAAEQGKRAADQMLAVAG